MLLIMFDSYFVILIKQDKILWRKHTVVIDYNNCLWCTYAFWSMEYIMKILTILTLKFLVIMSNNPITPKGFLNTYNLPELIRKTYILFTLIFFILELKIVI